MSAASLDHIPLSAHNNETLGYGMNMKLHEIVWGVQWEWGAAAVKEGVETTNRGEDGWHGDRNPLRSRLLHPCLLCSRLLRPLATESPALEAPPPPHGGPPTTSPGDALTQVGGEEVGDAARAAESSMGDAAARSSGGSERESNCCFKIEKSGNVGIV